MTTNRVVLYALILNLGAFLGFIAVLLMVRVGC